MRNAQLLAAIAAILVTACDPSDWKPDAPPAPGCSEERPDLCEEFEPAACEAEDKPDSNKHGAQGQNTLHWADLQIHSGPSWNWCNPSNVSCISNRWQWFSAVWVDTNNTNRTRAVHSISYEFGCSTVPGHLDFWDAEVIIRFNGRDADVANAHSRTTATFGGPVLRSGTTTVHRGLTWPAYGWGIFEMHLVTKAGAVLPCQQPWMKINSVRYKDGP